MSRSDRTKIPLAEDLRLFVAASLVLVAVAEANDEQRFIVTDSVND